MTFTWRHLAIVGSVAFVAGLLLERVTARPAAPTVRWLEHTRFEDREKVVDQVKLVAGPVRVVDRWFAPASPTAGVGCSSPTVIRERVTERAPVTAERRTETARAATIDTSRDLLVVPPPPSPRPGWAIAGGLQLLPDQRPTLQLGRRLFGPVWIEGQLTGRLALEPPAAAVLVRVEF